MRKWAPYADPRRQDIWTGVQNVIPTNGASYRTAPVFSYVTTAAITTGSTSISSPGTTLKVWCGIINAGTGVGYVGTNTNIYSSADGFITFSSRSRGGGYTSSATTWSFAQFGNITIAANKVDAMQSRDASGSSAFADLAGAPKAKIVVVQSNILLAFNIDDGADKPHCWAASDVADHTNWTTGEAVTATPILHRPGPITAAMALGGDVIVFKRSSIYRMRYVGSPIYWTVELIADGIGALTQDNVASCGDRLIFIDRQGPYVCDGASVYPLNAEGFDDPSSGASLLSKTCTAAVYWPFSKSVWFAYEGASGSDVLVYNMKTDAWGAFTVYPNSGTTALTGYCLNTGSPSAIDAVVTSAANEERGGAYFVKLSANPCVYKSAGVWGDGAVALQAYVETGFYGVSDDADTNVSGVIPILSRHMAGDAPAATGMTLYNSTSATTDAATSYGSAVTSSADQKRFDINQTAKWHRFKIQASAKPYEIRDVLVKMKPAGRT